MNLYHYTDLNAVHSILDTHKIRMTDIRFLNDKTEYLQGLKILQEASLQAFTEDSMYEYDKEFMNVIQNWFKDAFEELLNFENASEMFYVASFSRSSDTLSQWRSYGMFAIEFDYLKLKQLVSSLKIKSWASEKKFLQIEFIQCHYVCTKEGAIERALELLHSNLISGLLLFWQVNEPLDANLHLYDELKEILSMLATTFKHPSFIEEQEERLVISEEIVSDRIRFRVKNNILIPFYELDISPEVISGVKIGPVENQIITEQSLDIFNKHRAKKLDDEKYWFDIKKSDIPYREL